MPNLSQSVDDTAWVTGGARLFATDADSDTVDVVTGNFAKNSVFVAVTPCDAAMRRRPDPDVPLGAQQEYGPKRRCFDRVARLVP